MRRFTDGLVDTAAMNEAELEAFMRRFTYCGQEETMEDHEVVEGAKRMTDIDWKTAQLEAADKLADAVAKHLNELNADGVLSINDPDHPAAALREALEAYVEIRGEGEKPDVWYLWRLTQTNETGYDTYDSCIVVARSAEEAVLIHPNGTKNDDDAQLYSWAPPENVKAERIGIATTTGRGVVCASFNAG